MTITAPMPGFSMGYSDLLELVKSQWTQDLHNAKSAIRTLTKRRKVSLLQEMQINRTNFPSIHLPNTTTIFPKLEWDGLRIKPILHSGNTDENGGHRDLFNRSGLGPYHYHHTLGPHFPCCKSGLRQDDTYIVNPYTGKQINLGKPYVYQGEGYFSINLVAKALTAWDTMGASLGLLPVFPPHFNSGGSFNACNKGESTHPNGTLGERFSFTYPTLPIIGTLRNNTFFNADGDKGGELELLCHTSQAGLDPSICYAYVTLDEIRNYMISNGYFTDFSNSSSDIWNFTVIKPTVHITSPVNGSTFNIGDEIVVQASIKNAAHSQLFIDGSPAGSNNNVKDQSAVTFDKFILEEKNLGNISITVEAHPGGQTIIAKTVTSTLTINVEKPEEFAETINGREIFIPATVNGVVNEVPITLYPVVNWGIPGEGAYAKDDLELKDENGRYRIAVAPKILIPDYPNNGQIWGSDFKNISDRIDIVLKHKTTSEIKIIECIVHDLKAHSYSKYPDGHPNYSGNEASFEIDNGWIQTGIAYPHSWNATNGPGIALGNMDGSVVEFCGTESEMDFDRQSYELVKLIHIDKN